MTGATITASVCHAMKEQPKAAIDQPGSQGGEKSNGMDLGLRVLSYLISGVLVYGLAGWLGDHYLGTKFLLPIGIVAGAAFGAYVIIGASAASMIRHLQQVPRIEATRPR